MSKYIITLLVGCFITIGSLSAQDEYRLAQQYYRNGEYEKAKVIYEKLFNNTDNDFYFDRYMESVMALEDFDLYEKTLKKRIKQFPDKVQLYVKYGELYERQFKQAKADEQYRIAIDRLPPNRTEIVRLANGFTRIAKYDLALETYQKGSKLLKSKNMFAYEMGDLYRRNGNRELMIEYYLNSLEEIPTRISTLKTIFQRYFGEEDYKELQTQLYQRINDNPKVVLYPELLSWMFIQRKDYKNALRQVRAIDRRQKENGGRVFRLAQIASRAKDYDTAIEAYDYIVEKKGETNTYYLEAKRESLKNKRLRLVDGYDYNMENLRVLEAEYETFLDEFGRNTSTSQIIYELAELEAFYINDLDKAISLLEEMRMFAGIRRHLEAQAKLSLGDFYLMKGEIWESTLLYSQVDKAYKDDVLGQTARFKNAKLSYYNGDFEWAQAQFGVLKASTSKLIANDALDLSVFIMDNLALDTVALPMQLYAKADLLAFQNKYDRAFEVLDSVKSLYPNHSLEDDVLFTKAQIHLKLREVDKAIVNLQDIVAKFPESIRADNALFMLGDLYENHYNDATKAQEYYSQIILDYSDSTFTVEARKRFRKLRGDVQ